MGDKSKIEWTEATWNPIAGCSIVSPGCTNCYAMRMAWRIEKMQAGGHYAGTTQHSKAGPVWSGKVQKAPELLFTKPLRWSRPRMIFVNSMSDLFHEAVPDEWIDQVFAIMALCPQHTFQVLTKRAERMRAYCQDIDPRRADALGELVVKLGYDGPLELLRWPLPNVWLGVSAEDQVRADERIPHLLATPAAVRFVSAEPLLGPIRLPFYECHECFRGKTAVTQGVFFDEACPACDGTGVERPCVDWVIAGGESGRAARPMHPDWARSIRDQCQAAGVPFFFKQWGEFGPAFKSDLTPTGLPWSGADQCAVAAGTATVEQATRRLGKGRAGRLLDGREHNEMPEVLDVPPS